MGLVLNLVQNGLCESAQLSMRYELLLKHLDDAKAKLDLHSKDRERLIVKRATQGGQMDNRFLAGRTDSLP